MYRVERHSKSETKVDEECEKYDKNMKIPLDKVIGTENRLKWSAKTQREEWQINSMCTLDEESVG